MSKRKMYKMMRQNQKENKVHIANVIRESNLTKQRKAQLGQ